FSSSAPLPRPRLPGRAQPARRPGPAMPEQPARYTASFFGSFRVTIDDQLIGDQNRRKRSIHLLKWFLLNPGRQISTDELCTLFWPGRGKESAVNNLQVNLNHLRRVLEPRIRTRGASTFIHRSGKYNYYRFDHRDLWWTDAWDVRDL